MQTKSELLVDALNLPPEERAQLIEDLLSSFDSPERHRLDKLWATESESRIEAYEKGTLTASPIHSVFEKIPGWEK